MASTHETSSEAPAPDEIRAAVERMLVSDVFSPSPQLVAFLRFVVEALLHGKADRIKGYTIGVEVFRRDIKFDPQLDPIVRVEATRLRRTIERYYAGAGAFETIIIDLPRGSYVPVFRRRGAEAPMPSRRPLEILSHAARRRPVLASAIAAVFIAAVITAGVTLNTFIQQALSSGTYSSADAIGPLRPGNGMPTLVVQPFDVVGTADPRLPSAPSLLEKTRDAFSRFDAINIGSESLPAGERVDYRLFGFIEYHGDGTASLRFRLLDVVDGNSVWTRTFDRLAVGRDRAASEDGIVFELAATLLQPFGLIRSRERNKSLTSSDASDPRYRCLLLTSDAFRTFDPPEYDRARSCLEQLIAISPSFGDGFSYLASLYNREYLYGFGKGADDPRTLDRALQLARRGIELQPVSARANQVLSAVLFTRRDTTAAFAAVERAMALNPYDLIIVGEYGGRLITSGEIERGMQVLQRAAGDGGLRPSWHHFYLFLGSYLNGDLTEATRQAAEMTSDTYTHGLMARALAAAANKDQARAREALERLVALRPAWRSNPRGELEKYISSPLIVDRLVRDLAAAGLPGGV